MDESHRNRGDHSMLLLDWAWIDSGWTQCYRNQWRIYEVEPRAHDMAVPALVFTIFGYLYTMAIDIKKENDLTI